MSEHRHLGTWDIAFLQKRKVMKEILLKLLNVYRTLVLRQKSKILLWVW